MKALLKTTLGRGAENPIAEFLLMRREAARLHPAASRFLPVLMEDAAMLTNRACSQFQFVRASTLAAVSSPFQSGGFIFNAISILRQFPGLTPWCSAGILNPIPRIRDCGIGVALEVKTNPRDP